MLCGTSDSEATLARFEHALRLARPCCHQRRDSDAIRTCFAPAVRMRRCHVSNMPCRVGSGRCFQDSNMLCLRLKLQPPCDVDTIRTCTPRTVFHRGYGSDMDLSRTCSTKLDPALHRQCLRSHLGTERTTHPNLGAYLLLFLKNTGKATAGGQRGDD